jgi:tight adherence protein C
LQYAASALIFTSIVVLVTSVISIVRHRQLLSRRLSDANWSTSDRPAKSEPHRVILEDSLLSRFEDIVTPGNEKELAAIRKRLIRAGYRWPSAVRVYYAIRAGLALALSLIAAAMMPIIGPLLPLPGMVAAVVIPAGLGFLLPSLWVERQVQRRREAAELGFPDALDMLLVCIEAGNSIDQACRRVAREMSGVHPVLAEEFTIVNDELWAGKDRAQVFNDFADRLDVRDISAFATVLRQSDEYGVSIADTLRVYASEMRNKRILKAEEKANLMPVKLAMGSILFTVPPTMLVMAGPSLIAMIRSFSAVSH